MVPVDALEGLHADGVVGEVHPWYYVTTGTGTTVTHAERMGEEIARELINEGVHAVLVTST
jgi:glycine reductase